MEQHSRNPHADENGQVRFDCEHGFANKSCSRCWLSIEQRAEADASMAASTMTSGVRGETSTRSASTAVKLSATATARASSPTEPASVVTGFCTTDAACCTAADRSSLRHSLNWFYRNQTPRCTGPIAIKASIATATAYRNRRSIPQQSKQHRSQNRHDSELP